MLDLFEGPGRSRGSTPPDTGMMHPDDDDDDDEEEFDDKINPPDKAVSSCHFFLRNKS